VVSPIPLFPSTAGGPARIVGYLRYFRDAGFEVHLAITRRKQSERQELEALVDHLHLYNPKKNGGDRKGKNSPRSPRSSLKRAARFLLVDLRHGIRRAKYERRFLPRRFQPSHIERLRVVDFDAFVGKVARKTRPQAVIANFVWTAGGVNDVPPNALTMIDTHDIQHLRAKAGKEAGYDLSRIQVSRKEECRELKRADILLAIQSEEMEILRTMCPDSRIMLFEHGVPIPEREATPEDLMEVLFIANHYEPNIEGIKAFIELAWPTIRKQHPKCRLTVCGRVCKALEPELPGVDLMGIVPELESYYRRASIVINPVPFGTGLKIKTVEALVHAKCLITTDWGITGLPVPGEDAPEYCVVRAIGDMAEPVIELLADVPRRVAIEEEALALACERFSPEGAYGELAALIRKVPTY